jgi:hypothetical protein
LGCVTGSLDIVRRAGGRRLCGERFCIFLKATLESRDVLSRKAKVFFSERVSGIEAAWELRDAGGAMTGILLVAVVATGKAEGTGEATMFYSK